MLSVVQYNERMITLENNLHSKAILPHLFFNLLIPGLAKSTFQGGLGVRVQTSQKKLKSTTITTLIYST